MSVMQILLPACCSGVLSAAFSYCLARWSGSLGLVANPRPDRWHETPTPNTGGLGIFIGCASAYLLFTPAGFGAIAAGASLVAFLGFVDDRVQLPPLAKLAGQGAGAAVVIMSGITLHWTPWFWANVVLTVLWIIGITNAFNLIDNMDGLCGGVAAIVAVSGAVLAFLEQDDRRILLLTIIAAACIGFLVFNHKPARIFMGDCGSMFLGFSLASLAAASTHDGDPMFEGLYALPAFFYPIFDTALVSVVRRAAGKPISVGGRDHSSHRLVFTGLTERETVWILWPVAGICAACGPLAYHRPAEFLFITASVLAALTAFGGFLALLPGFGLQSQPQPAQRMVELRRPGSHPDPSRMAVLSAAESGADDTRV